MQKIVNLLRLNLRSHKPILVDVLYHPAVSKSPSITTSWFSEVLVKYDVKQT